MKTAARKRKIILALAAAIIIVLAVFIFRSGEEKEELALQNNSTASPKTAALSKNKADDSSAQKSSSVPAVAVPEKSNTPSASATKIEPNSTDNSNVPTIATTEVPAPKIINRLVSWGFTKTNGREIDTIIIHSSYNALGGDPHDVNTIINKEYKPNDVSPHYIIGRDGIIYRLVPDQDIAYHAGVSRMPDGRTNVNDFSLGIEIVETMSESPSAAQYASLNSLVDYLAAKYPIKHILGHSDIAPGRKTDPWNFDWKKLQLGKEK